ncbi:hypothetical protein EYF80_034872 [Liparis tanakae]|uniref:Uncharacterized protein n=1 Tax=Liparis tanakae TaxID=230148 RepID=A0A4Z2GMZ6_9TELE|nr:hypothetical protein EYF80_034872 [Liparis tanakae]
MQDVRGDLWVGPALRLPQAPRPAAPLRLLQAGETFGLVEVEVLVRHHAFEPQEVLNPAHLARRVRHQALAADEEEARQREEAQPVLQVLGVDADAHGAPGRVDEARGGIAEGQVLEGREPGRFGQSLGVVGHGPGHGVTHHHDEFGVAAYGEDAARGLLSRDIKKADRGDEGSVSGFGSFPLVPGVSELRKAVIHTAPLGPRPDPRTLLIPTSLNCAEMDSSTLKELFEKISQRYVDIVTALQHMF